MTEELEHIIVIDELKEHSDINSDNIVDFDVEDFGLAADGVHYSYRKLNMKEKNIESGEFIKKFEFIEHLNMEKNKIINLDFISSMSFLTELNISENYISDATSLKQLTFLRKLNMSSNYLKDTSFLESLRALEQINLSKNQITVVSGIENCHLLEYVDISHNLLTEIPNILASTIRNLNLKNNKIHCISGLRKLPYLMELDLSSNNISCLEPLKESISLVCLNLENNEITDIQQIHSLRHLKLLSKLILRGNLICELPDYPLLAIYLILQLDVLDGVDLTTKTKVEAKIYFDPPKQSLAASDHRTQLSYNIDISDQLQPTTIPEYHVAYPLFVLVGPPGACKKLLCLRLEEEFGKQLEYSPPHTTRQPHSFEKNGREYNFVSRNCYMQDIKEGNFIQSFTFKGEFYGLKHQIINRAASFGRTSITQMDVEGALSLTKSFWRPKMILLVFEFSDVHMQLMRLKSVYSDEEMSVAVSQNCGCMQFYEQNSEFFDLVVKIDNLESAYMKLKEYFNEVFNE